MASGRLCRFVSTRLFNGITLHGNEGCLTPVRLKSNVTGPTLHDPFSDVDIGVTSDGKTIVCHHPTVDIPYELTQPIERPDPLTNTIESHDQILKSHLSKEVLSKEGPSIEELSKMFFTTKHRWYPIGQYHLRRIKKNPPKDR